MCAFHYLFSDNSRIVLQRIHYREYLPIIQEAAHEVIYTIGENIYYSAKAKVVELPINHGGLKEIESGQAL